MRGVALKEDRLRKKPWNINNTKNWGKKAKEVRKRRSSGKGKNFALDFGENSCCWWTWKKKKIVITGQSSAGGDVCHREEGKKRGGAVDSER